MPTPILATKLYIPSPRPKAARRLCADGMAHLLQARNTSDVVGDTISLADIWIAQGRPRGSAQERTPVNQNLIDPMSERELDVLRLLATDLSGPEIARQLSVSLSTLRTHTQNIYSKLGVNSRRTAISRAEELNLL